jgi:hypothetical protein
MTSLSAELGFSSSDDEAETVASDYEDDDDAFAVDADEGAQDAVAVETLRPIRPLDPEASAHHGFVDTDTGHPNTPKKDSREATAYAAVAGLAQTDSSLRHRQVISTSSRYLITIAIT